MKVILLLAFVAVVLAQTTTVCDWAVPYDKMGFCIVGCKCYTFELISIVETIQNEITVSTVTFDVTNNCKWAVSFIAIGTGGLTVLTPEDGSKYTGQFGTVYHVVHTNTEGNPSFESVKFEAAGDLFKNGATERFVITVEGTIPETYKFSLQGHNGAKWETFTLSSEGCSCDCPTSTCPLGYTGANCDTCETDPGTGYVRRCDYQDSDVNPYYVAASVSSAYIADLPYSNYQVPGQVIEMAFGAASAWTGYTLDCNCNIVYKQCEPGCSFAETCNMKNGVCEPATEPVTEAPTPAVRSVAAEPVYDSCFDFENCDDCSLAATKGLVNCTWCTSPFRTGCVDLGVATCPAQALACQPSYVPFIPPPCPDQCSGTDKGVCDGNGTCICKKNWEGINCAELYLSQAEVAAVTLSTVALALIIVGAVLFFGGFVFGAKKFYDYHRLRGASAGNIKGNPMYEESRTAGESSLYEQPGRSEHP